MAQTSGKRLAGWLAVSLSAHVLLLTLPVPGHPVRPPVFSFLHVSFGKAPPAPTAASVKPAGQPTPHAPAQRRTPKPVPAEPEITPPPAAPTPAALDAPGVMPPFGQTARRGWRPAPPTNPMTAEYWRQRQAMLLAEEENRRLEQENRQRVEAAAAVATVKDHE